MDTLCRLCCKKTNDLFNTFDRENPKSKFLRKYIHIICGVEMLVTDEVTTSVCGCCLEIVTKAHLFRQIAMKNDKKIKGMISTPNTTEAQAATDANANLLRLLKPQTNRVHPSVMEVLQAFPNIIIPEDILDLNIKPELQIIKSDNKLMPPPHTLQRTPINIKRKNNNLLRGSGYKKRRISLRKIFPKCVRTRSTLSKHTILKMDIPIVQPEDRSELQSLFISSLELMPVEQPTNSATIKCSSENISIDVDSCAADKSLLIIPTTFCDVFICNICNEMFDSKIKLKSHIRTHNKCSYCKKSFKNFNALQKHINTSCTIIFAIKQPKLCLEKCDRVPDIINKYPEAFNKDVEYAVKKTCTDNKSIKITLNKVSYIETNVGHVTPTPVEKLNDENAMPFLASELMKNDHIKTSQSANTASRSGIVLNNAYSTLFSPLTSKNTYDAVSSPVKKQNDSYRISSPSPATESNVGCTIPSTINKECNTPNPNKDIPSITLRSFNINQFCETSKNPFLQLNVSKTSSDEILTLENCPTEIIGNVSATNLNTIATAIGTNIDQATEIKSRKRKISEAHELMKLLVTPNCHKKGPNPLENNIVTIGNISPTSLDITKPQISQTISTKLMPTNMKRHSVTMEKNPMSNTNTNVVLSPSSITASPYVPCVKNSTHPMQVIDIIDNSDEECSIQNDTLTQNKYSEEYHVNRAFSAPKPNIDTLDDDDEVVCISDDEDITEPVLIFPNKSENSAIKNMFEKHLFEAGKDACVNVCFPTPSANYSINDKKSIVFTDLFRDLKEGPLAIKMIASKTERCRIRGELSYLKEIVPKRSHFNWSKIKSIGINPFGSRQNRAKLPTLVKISSLHNGKIINKLDNKVAICENGLPSSQVLNPTLQPKTSTLIESTSSTSTCKKFLIKWVDTGLELVPDSTHLQSADNLFENGIVAEENTANLPGTLLVIPENGANTPTFKHLTGQSNNLLQFNSEAQSNPILISDD